MRKTLLSVALATALVALGPQQAAAQVEKDYTDIGAVIGIGNIGEATVAFGGRFEKIFKKLPDLGDGLLGILVSADIYSWNTGPYNFRYIPIGATANYHFKIDPAKKLDVFLGAGLGFSAVSCDVPDVTGTINERVVSASVRSTAAGNCGGTSGVYFIGRAGGRYFATKKTSIYADVGAGAATLNIGVTRRIK